MTLLAPLNKFIDISRIDRHVKLFLRSISFSLLGLLSCEARDVTAT